MAKVVNMTIGIADKFNIGNYETVCPIVELRVDLEEGETPKSVIDSVLPQVVLLWEMALCNRLGEKIVQQAASMGFVKMDTGAQLVYRQLYAKHFGG